MNSISFHISKIVFIFCLTSIFIGSYTCINKYFSIMYPYINLTQALLVLLVLIGLTLGIEYYNKFKKKVISKNIRNKIYKISFRLITLYSIFLVGLWKCSESQTGIMPTCYLIFIITAASISALLNKVELDYIYDSAKYNKNNFLQLTINKSIITGKINNNRSVILSIPTHIINAKILGSKTHLKV